jgi:hypothetical protein
MMTLPSAAWRAGDRLSMAVNSQMASVDRLGERIIIVLRLLPVSQLRPLCRKTVAVTSQKKE